MNSDDLEKCRQIAKNLKSERYKKYNFIFLEPFPLETVPDYLDVVDRQLDLSTVAKNLEAGQYSSRSQFFADASLIFQNAIKYHSGREATKWIIRPAKEMLKIVQREQQRLEKGSTKGLVSKKSQSVKIKLPKSDSDRSSSKAADSEPSAPPPKPKLKIKASKQDKDVPVKAKPTQPKLKLKLSLTKKAPPPPPSEPPPAPPAPKETASSADNDSAEKSSNKVAIRVNGPRGKELPKGVTAKPKPPPKTTSKSTTKSTTKSSTKTTKKTSSKKTTTKSTKVKKTTKAAAPAPPPESESAAADGKQGMTPANRISCWKVVAGLKRRKSKAVAWFLSPVSDKAIISDYRAKIKNPMDLNTVQSKLEKKEYVAVEEFVLDMRRIFANCLRYNTSIKDSLRPFAVEVLESSEELISIFLSKQGSSYNPLLYCWKLCISVLDTLYNLTNPDDGQPTAYYFLHPVSLYCGGHLPPDYKTKVKRPMDFGTVTSMLIEGRYSSVDEFASDCRLVLENCITYYGGREDGRLFIEYANRLKTVLTQQLETFYRYLKSPSGVDLRRKAEAPSKALQKLPTPMLMAVISDLRELKYTDKATKITEPAMAPFEKPVSLSAFPDYLQYVETPMDLQAVEKKLKNDQYDTPEDFEYDMSLIFRNCETYNVSRKGDHLVAMAKYGAKHFRRLFASALRALDDPSSVATAAKDAARDTSPSNASSGKKLKIDSSGVSKGKNAPRISITAAQVSSAAEKAAQTSKSPKQSLATVRKADAPTTSQPIPLHIAIARVKEAFPLRRAHKSLQSWEADCARFFKELMRHSWISAARPKFIFHVPVPVLFPELSDAYSMKIRKPMDLTTVECSLLAGNRYAGPEDFVQDVALVFSNAIRFNKDGHDVGDPLSCAYYDASIHLLRYTRWLSLELLANHIVESDQVEESGTDGLPPFSWKLTTKEKARARKEMEALISEEPIEKSVEGDRYTWMEAECEKLLKALRHQSDLRYMTFFIQPNYPPDYAAFISKPMDWESVQRSLKNRSYDSFGEIIQDLRLIFTNALKYNSRLKGTDTVSGRAYEAAKYMSTKLETAINKLMLSVSDRLERERIDHANAEREIEAAERAEEAKIREAWKKEANENTSGNKPEGGQRLRSVRKPLKRRDLTDFEIPFFDDEDDGQHERSYFEVVKQQKAMFERQRQDLSKMRQTAMTAGSLVFGRAFRREEAASWLKNLSKKEKNVTMTNPKLSETSELNEQKEAQDSKQSIVGQAIDEDRKNVFQMKVVRKKRKRSSQTVSLE